MNKETLRRLFRSIDGEPEDDIVKVAFKIIEEEESKGHLLLAKNLREILDAKIKSSFGLKKELKSIFDKDIPVSRRYNIPLATHIERENLRHHMILPNEVEKRFQRIEKEYVARERLAHNGLKPRQKILFYGPPGCGKSMGAERIAWNIGLPFLKVRFEAIISSYLGESAVNLRKMFESIKFYPCVLLLDEFDFFAKSREIGQDVGEMHRIVNMLLYLLDEFNAPGILIATTNLEGTLDKALFRRFDEVLEIPKPGKKEVIDLLIDTLSAIQVSKVINFDQLVNQMNDLSAAQIVKVAQDAAKLSIIEGKGIVEQCHLQSSLKEILNQTI
ncbi:MAG: ATP-binding protein [Bacteroidota bacterium]|nr:ATP-binding protein [Bacteroidota bacterium]MDP4197094.1 ATP-binding protein [Bacteroidota bacterium]